ncbi:hypothetical protein ASD13_02370 [Microbacterium sp. Root1433D1]|nr:hypothetical protein ASD13_02370 [Microbacterium sp. Root1433D1]
MPIVDCEEYRISCQLERIADSVGGGGGETFVATLLATVVGALIALLGSWLLDRARSKKDAADRYERNLDAALQRTMEEIGERMRELATAKGWPLTPPTKLSASASLARMVARGADADATKQMQYAIDRIGDSGEGSTVQRRQVEIVGQIIRAWREGSHTAAKAQERFAGVAPDVGGTAP